MTIYSRDGKTPYPEAMQMQVLAAAEARNQILLRSRRRHLLLSPDGTPAYRVEKDRLGAPYKVFREVSAYTSRPGRNSWLMRGSGVQAWA